MQRKYSASIPCIMKPCSFSRIFRPCVAFHQSTARLTTQDTKSDLQTHSLLMVVSLEGEIPPTSSLQTSRRPFFEPWAYSRFRHLRHHGLRLNRHCHQPRPYRPSRPRARPPLPALGLREEPLLSNIATTKSPCFRFHPTASLVTYSSRNTF
jgi:hypothetical protein